MKRWLFYGAVLILIAFLPKVQTAGTDVGQLEPVEVVRVSIVDGWVRMETDTGQQGRGENLESALLELKRTADREIFLDTADYLLLSTEALSQMPELMELLRPACQICLESGEADLETVARFLATHEPGLTLRDYRAERQTLPVLMVREERMKLVQS